MSEVQIVMYVGFLLAAYSVIGNDVIQTLGTFISSNKKTPWFILFLFASVILAVVLFYGWWANNGDVSYGRLIGNPQTHGFSNPVYKNPTDIVGFGWPYLIPPLVLLVITRFGIPVSTSFMILTFFNPKNLYDMVMKSMSGYLVAFVTAIAIYMIIAPTLEKRFLRKKVSPRNLRWWTLGQWLSTGFLWSQWLIQDFANIYVYLPRQISLETLIITLVIFTPLLAYIFYHRGGAIQTIVKNKVNTADIRSATIIDLIYGLVLLFFKELNNVPMSTTWVFIGLLAGREIAIRYRIHKKVSRKKLRHLGQDLFKVFFGLLVSLALVFIIRWLTI